MQMYIDNFSVFCFDNRECLRTMHPFSIAKVPHFISTPNSQDRVSSTGGSGRGKLPPKFFNHPLTIS